MSRTPLSRRAALSCLAVAASSAFVPRNAHAQFVCICSFTERGWSRNLPGGSLPTQPQPAASGTGLPQIVKTIEHLFNATATIDVYIVNRARNAFAGMNGGRRILVADPEFLEEIHEKTHTKWGPVQVIAHEIGHHIAGQSGYALEDELKADYWSGQALSRLGASRERATAAIRVFGTDFDTQTHPNKYTRAQTIERGWDDAAAGRMDKRYCISC